MYGRTFRRGGIKMKVLSLFDGISCGMVALERAGIKVDRYVAYEINKNAIKVSKNNYPNIEHLGDVVDADFTKQKMDLLLGGSPCQNLCPASNPYKMKQKQGLKGEKSILFWQFERALRESKPKYFLFENVASMNNSDKNIITSALRVQPIKINSNLVSAQNRERLYWTNIPNVKQPKDKNIKLSNILLEFNKQNLIYSPKAIAYMNREVGKTGRKRLYNGQGVTFYGSEKSSTVTANFRKGVPYNVLAYSETEMRKFSPEECEMLQTLPIGYTAGISNTNRYEVVGNGWTVDVIAHILSFLKDI